MKIAEASESSSEQDMFSGDEVKNPSGSLVRALYEHSVRLDPNRRGRKRKN
jgi:hypothetical protein